METVEVTATYHGQRFRFENGDGDVIIGDVQHVDGEQPTPLEMYSVKGPDDPSRPLGTHRTYRFYGSWKDYRNRRTGDTEKQFHFSTYVEAEPATRAGVVAYLKEAGRGRGVGQAIATKIWERFGSDSVRILREQPEVVAAAVRGLSIDSAKTVALALEERKSIEHCSISLMGLLDRRGFPKATARRAMALWGNQAAELIERNPYLLMRFRGCGFKGTDKFYLELGHDPGRLKRQALCAWYALASDTTGHTWYPRAVAYQGIREMISGAEPRPELAECLAIRAGLLDRIAVDQAGRIVQKADRYFLAEAKAARNERFIARQVVDAEEEPITWPAADALAEISAHQADRLSRSLRGTIGVFGGGPGTGKTFTAAALVKWVSQFAGGKSSGKHVAIAAPTGKAAVRITEALASYGIQQRAKTIHSLLGVDSSENGWKFKHDANNPLDVRFLVVDEASMIDTDLMSSLLAARGRGTHVLFVGDVNQLPPVGHGAPLRDFIRAGFPYGELTEIKRNDGGIVQACADIRAGRRFKCEGNLVHRDAHTPKVQTTECLAVCDLAKSIGLDPIWDVQIVVPVNAKSPVSHQALNKVLQAELNHNPGVAGSPFRVGDKIVNTANGFFPVVSLAGSDSDEVQRNDRGEVYVANGELAEVAESTPAYTTARLTSPDRVIRIPRSAGNQAADDDSGDAPPSTGCMFELGYALSVHKSQGSEWPIVAVVIDQYPGARMVCSREWTYTAISRAKKECHIIGQLETAYRFCRRQQIDERQTFLVEQVARERAANMLAEL